jgi:hypothetical protein
MDAWTLQNHDQLA